MIMVDLKLQSAYRILASWTFLTAGEVSRWLDVPPRKVLMFVEQWLVIPTDPAPGSGKSRKYSFIDLVLFEVMVKLDSFGLAPRYLRSLAKDLDTIVRERINQQNYKFSLLYITHDEGDSLRVVAGDNPERFATITLVVDLAKIELDVLNIFQKNAPAEGGGRELLGMIGKEYDNTLIEKILRDKGVETRD